MLCYTIRVQLRFPTVVCITFRCYFCLCLYQPFEWYKFYGPQMLVLSVSVNHNSQIKKV